MSLILGLWSIVLQPGQTLSQTTTPAIQITNISFGAEVKGDARSVVSIKYPEFEQGSDDEDESEDEDEEDDSEIKLPKLITKEAVLAILKPNVTEQVSVNISLVEDVEVVEFSVTGPNAVHVVGHYVRQEDFDQDPYSDEEYGSGDEEIDSDEFDEDDSELEGLSGMIGEDSDEEMDEGRFEELKEELKKNAEKHMSSNLEPNVVLPQTLPIPTTSTDTTPTIPAPLVTVAPTSSSSSSSSESEPAESKPDTTNVATDTTTDTTMTDASDITINVVPAAPAVDSDASVTASLGTPPLVAATLPAAASATPVAPATAAPPTPMTASQKRRERKRRNSGNSKKRVAEVEAEAPSSAADTAADESTTLSKNQKKKLAKKLKGADGAAAPAPAAAEAPKPAEKAAAPKKEAPKTQTLAGGLIITDAKKGDGPVAKSGKKVGMRYIGKLENGKIFDSNTKGAPLVFTLGRGEVIKGWDMGVAGMAVGGERKLTIPAALAYGKKGTQGIPGNATLIFDVKLVSLK